MCYSVHMEESQQQRIESRITRYSADIDAHLARTWEEDDPDITSSAREAAALLGMSSADLWKAMEVWGLVAGREAARRNLARLVRGDRDCR